MSENYFFVYEISFVNKFSINELKLLITYVKIKIIGLILPIDIFTKIIAIQ